MVNVRIKNRIKLMIQTRKRKIVLKTLKEQSAPVDVGELRRILRKEMNNTTIYRALELFTKEGLVKRVNWGKDKAYYEIASLDHHHHLVCNNCGDSEDITPCDMLPSVDQILKKSKKFTQIISHSLEFFGFCKKCVA